MQKLCLMKLVRPDCLVPAIQQYVVGSLGPHFGQPGPVSLASVRKDSNNTTPIIFVLSPGLAQLYLVTLAKELWLSILSATAWKQPLWETCLADQPMWVI